MSTAPSFRFRLERVRVLRQRKENLARQELARAISQRADSQARLRRVEEHLEQALTHQRLAAGEGESASTVSAAELLARQAFVEHVEAQRTMGIRELERHEADVEDRDTQLGRAAREHEILERLKDRRRAEHEHEAGRREGAQLDEIALERFPPERRMSATAVGGLEPIAAAGAGAGEPVAAATALGAGERVQQLQALIAQIEHRQSGGGGVSGASSTFASALDAAQSGGPSEPTAYASTVAYPSTPSLLGDYPSTAPTPSPYTSTTPAADAGTATTSSAYAPLIEQAAARYGLDPAILSGLIQQESGFDPSAHSSAGALGLTQLMPSTAASLGVAEPLDPAQSIEGGARYLSQLMHQFAGNTADALAAYNAGPGAVQQYGGVPPYAETQQYVTKVLGYAAAYSQGGGGGSPSTDTPAPASTVPVATPEVLA